MRLKLVQVGEPVLRQLARPLTVDEIRSSFIQQLIEWMRETMRDAPGVGLAAPQVGVPLQLAVIEDRPEYTMDLPEPVLARQERSPVPFHVIVNPQLVIVDNTQVRFFEGCLSVTGFQALVARARGVRVDCINEKGEPALIETSGWHARILQHEIDHLRGTLYLDRMETRSLMTRDNYARYWQSMPIDEVCRALGLTPEVANDSGELGSMTPVLDDAGHDRGDDDR